MKRQWRELTSRFDALSRRERAMVAAAVLLVGGWLTYSWLVDPPLQRHAAANKRSALAIGETAAIETQLAILSSQVTDPDAAAHAALRELRTRVAALDARLATFQGSMVPPGAMPAFLESLLVRHRSLELLALRTLPVKPLVEKSADEKIAAGGAGDGTAQVYQHGVEIRIAGTYHDLLSYLAELERMPQRVIWNRVTLSVDQYPRSLMTLTVYTLSLDKQWLVL